MSFATSPSNQHHESRTRMTGWLCLSAAKPSVLGNPLDSISSAGASLGNILMNGKSAARFCPSHPEEESTKKCY